MPRNDVAMAALRIAIGVLFLFFGEYKVADRGFVQSAFHGWIARFLDHGVYPFMVPVLRGLVLPHERFWAWLVALGELAIGIALVAGIAVRLASAFGFVYMLALLFSSNYPGAHARPWQYLGASLDHLVLALCFAAFLVGRADRALSPRGLRGNRSAHPDRGGAPPR